MIIKKYYKLIRVSHEDSAYMRLKNISNEAGIFKMVKTGTPTAPNLEYSLDGTTWTTYDFTTLPEVTVAAGANIYFRGTNANHLFNSSDSAYVTFSFNKTCEAHGNICSLFDTDPTVFSAITNIGDRGLHSLFRNLTTLTTAPSFESIESINQLALYYCFYGCTSLTTAPTFSNLTTLGWGSLRYAFQGCTALTTAPTFSNLTTLGIYSLGDCFRGCTSLTIAPTFSNLTTIGDYGLDNCFYGCTSLVTAPDFSSVTSVGSGGLGHAFQNCYKLSTATAPNVQDLTVNSILSSWLNQAGTQATGTKVVRVPTGATIATGSASGIPSGWTRVDY